jgi:hypothetical protein
MWFDTDWWIMSVSIDRLLGNSVPLSNV